MALIPKWNARVDVDGTSHQDKIRRLDRNCRVLAESGAAFGVVLPHKRLSRRAGLI